MTTASILLEDLRARGVTVRIEGADLKLRPAGAIDAATLERVRQHKPALLQLLAAPAPQPLPPCHAWLKDFRLLIDSAGANTLPPGPVEVAGETILKANEFVLKAAQVIVTFEFSTRGRAPLPEETRTMLHYFRALETLHCAWQPTGWLSPEELEALADDAIATAKSKAQAGRTGG